MSGPHPSSQPGADPPPEPSRKTKWVPYLEALPLAAAGAPPAPATPLAASTPNSHSTKTYVVPRRFGMAAILAMNTLLSFLFAILAWHQAHPVVFVFFVLLALAICLVQMRFGETPRLASTFAGAVLVLVFVGVFSVSEGDPWIIAFAALPMGLVGAGLGYLAGTVAAGLFLLADLFTAWWNNRNDAIKANPSAGNTA